MQFFGTILNGAMNGAGTSEIWASIREAATAAGLDPANLGISGADISQLRGYAGSIVRSMRTFDTMAPDLALPAGAIAEAPWSMGPGQRDLAPSYTIRFVTSMTDPAGNQTTQWMSYQTDSLPGTVGGVIDAADTAARSLAERYGSAFAGLAGVHITVSR